MPASLSLPLCQLCPSLHAASCFSPSNNALGAGTGQPPKPILEKALLVGTGSHHGQHPTTDPPDAQAHTRLLGFSTLGSYPSGCLGAQGSAGGMRILAETWHWGVRAGEEGHSRAGCEGPLGCRNLSAPGGKQSPAGGSGGCQKVRSPPAQDLCVVLSALCPWCAVSPLHCPCLLPGTSVRCQCWC